VLAKEFISRFNDQLNLNITQISPDLLDLLSLYKWPGNVRELEHVIESAMSIAEHTAAEVILEDLPTFLVKRMLSNLSANKSSNTSVTDIPTGKPLVEYLRQCETDLLQNMLKMTNGNVSDSAKQLGISRQDLHYRLRKLGIKSTSYKTDKADFTK